jgi:phenylacetic acid degradation operon negative regulatory protein
MDELLRRQSVGAPAARSTLLTLLGEFVAPRGESVRRKSLTAGLEAVGYRAATARQAVTRSIKAGWLEPETGNDGSTLVISEETTEVLRTGYPRIFGFGDPWTWDGRWLLLVVRIPERRRDLRDRLRTQLEWAGFGSLGGGLWITPRAGREAEVRASVESNPEIELLGFSAKETLGLGDPRSIVSQAWDLPAVAVQYREFTRAIRSLRPRSDQEVFREQTSIVHAWRKFPFLDPELPDQLLPDGWPGAEARDLFRDRHAAWQHAAERFFDATRGL